MAKKKKEEVKKSLLDQITKMIEDVTDRDERKILCEDVKSFCDDEIGIIEDEESEEEEEDEDDEDEE